MNNMYVLINPYKRNLKLRVQQVWIKLLSSIFLMQLSNPSPCHPLALPTRARAGAAFAQLRFLHSQFYLCHAKGKLFSWEQSEFKPSPQATARIHHGTRHPRSRSHVGSAQTAPRAFTTWSNCSGRAAGRGCPGASLGSRPRRDPQSSEQPQVGVSSPESALGSLSTAPAPRGCPCARRGHKHLPAPASASPPWTSPGCTSASVQLIPTSVPKAAAELRV